MVQLTTMLGVVVAVTGLAVSVLFTYHVSEDGAFTLATVKLGNTTHEFTRAQGSPQCITGTSGKGFVADKHANCPHMITHADAPADKLTCGGLTTSASDTAKSGDPVGLCATACKPSPETKALRIVDVSDSRTNNALASFVSDMQGKATELGADCTKAGDEKCRRAFQSLFNGACGREHFGESEFKAPVTTFQLRIAGKVDDNTDKHTLTFKNATVGVDEQTFTFQMNDVKSVARFATVLGTQFPGMSVVCKSGPQWDNTYEEPFFASGATAATDGILSMICLFTALAPGQLDKTSHLTTHEVGDGNALASGTTAKSSFTYASVTAAGGVTTANTQNLKFWGRIHGAKGGTLTVTNWPRKKLAAPDTYTHTCDMVFTQGVIAVADGVSTATQEQKTVVKELHPDMTETDMMNALNKAFGDDLVESVEMSPAAWDNTGAIKINFAADAMNPHGDLSSGSVTFTGCTTFTPANHQVVKDGTGADVTLAIGTTHPTAAQVSPSGKTRLGTAYTSTYAAPTADKGFTCSALKNDGTAMTMTENCPSYVIGRAHQKAWAKPWLSYAPESVWGHSEKTAYYTLEELMTVDATWRNCMATESDLKADVETPYKIFKDASIYADMSAAPGKTITNRECKKAFATLRCAQRRAYYKHVENEAPNDVADLEFTSYLGRTIKRTVATVGAPTQAVIEEAAPMQSFQLSSTAARIDPAPVPNMVAVSNSNFCNGEKSCDVDEADCTLNYATLATGQTYYFLENEVILGEYLSNLAATTVPKGPQRGVFAFKGQPVADVGAYAGQITGGCTGTDPMHLYSQLTPLRNGGMIETLPSQQTTKAPAVILADEDTIPECVSAVVNPVDAVVLAVHEALENICYYNAAYFDTLDETFLVTPKSGNEDGTGINPAKVTLESGQHPCTMSTNDPVCLKMERVIFGMDKQRAKGLWQLCGKVEHKTPYSAKRLVATGGPVTTKCKLKQGHVLEYDCLNGGKQTFPGKCEVGTNFDAALITCYNETVFKRQRRAAGDVGDTISDRNDEGDVHAQIAHYIDASLKSPPVDGSKKMSGVPECVEDNIAILMSVHEFDVVVMALAWGAALLSGLFFMSEMATEKADQYFLGMLCMLQSSMFMTIGVILSVKVAELTALDTSGSCMFGGGADAEVGSALPLYIAAMSLAYVAFLSTAYATYRFFVEGGREGWTMVPQMKTKVDGFNLM